MGEITPQTRRVFTLFALLQLAAIGLADFETSYEISLEACYFIPVAFAAWFLGLRTSMTFAVIAAFTTAVADSMNGLHYSRPWMAWEHVIMHIVVFGFVAFSFGFFRNSIRRERERTKHFEGMVLTFCSSCTRVKDAEDNWRELASLLHDAAGAQMCTKLCPTCARSTYAGLANIFPEKDVS